MSKFILIVQVLLVNRVSVTAGGSLSTSRNMAVALNNDNKLHN